MGRNRTEFSLFRQLAEEFGLSESEISRIVCSFFDIIVQEARTLPFNTGSRIYSREKFNGLAFVHQIPYLGRIGPVYSRYLNWRVNESKALEQVLRSSCRSRITQDDIENMAKSILFGKASFKPKVHKKSELYNNVWLVGEDGKKLARQVIKKK